MVGDSKPGMTPIRLQNRMKMKSVPKIGDIVVAVVAHLLFGLPLRKS